MYIENDIEQWFRNELEEYGFKVYKLKTPGRVGVMDRMIVRPSYSPGPPLFVELKQHKRKPDPRQAVIAADWERRGVTILKPIAGIDEARQRVQEIIILVCAASPLKDVL